LAGRGRGSGAGLACVLVLAASGCGVKDEGPPVYPVRGQVLFRGTPAAGADVFLHPADGGDPRAAPHPHGKADARGQFRLTRRRLDDGAPAGGYVVTIFWAAAENVEEPSDRLQGRYQSPKASKLRVQVKPGDNDLPPFNLQ